MPATTKREKLPPTQVGVRETINTRRILMVRPVCPIQDDPEKDGYTGENKCSLEGLGWWVKCEERGHDPYYRIEQTIKTRPLIEEVDGKKLVVGQEQTVIERKRLNAASVALTTRVNSGRGPTLKHDRFGFKFLQELGYDPVCEFRNCELPVKVKSRYGFFCGDRHARLVGADVEVIVLEANPNRRGSWNSELNKLDISPFASGETMLQQPPDIEW